MRLLCRVFGSPDLIPRREFSRRDLIPCKIPFMQGKQLGLRHLLELPLIAVIDPVLQTFEFRRTPISCPCERGQQVDNFSQCITVFQSERIRFTKRLPYCGALEVKLECSMRNFRSERFSDLSC